MNNSSSLETKQADIRYNAVVRDTLVEVDPNMLLADGFDNCIIGWCYTPGSGHRVVYDTEKIIKNLITQDNLSLEEAWEHFEFNIEGSYIGERTPVFLRRLWESTLSVDSKSAKST